MSVFAIDIGGTAIKSGLFDEQGVLLCSDECPTQAQKGVPALLDKLCAMISAQHGIEAVGVSSSGQVDAKAGRIVFATDALPGYTGTPLRQLLQERTGLPIALDNDVNCAAIGEAHFGAGRDHEDFLCITYGTGIGGTIVIGKQVYYGACGVAGEFGHMVTHADGLPCVCGKQGCYEMYGSTRALSANVRALTGQVMNGRKIFEMFSDPAIRAEIDKWIDEIVCGLVSLTHIFNPSCIILGGGILNEAYVLNEIRTRHRKRVIQSFAGCVIERAQIGNNAGIYGAYWNATHLDTFCKG